MIRTAVIAEDEIPSGQRLERLLIERGFTVLAIVPSAAKLKSYLSENTHPDWLFLDIELRDDSVFEALKRVQVESRIVFTTAYPDKALEAFRHGGIDYLLKPIDEAKLDSAIGKIERFGHLLKPGSANSEERAILVSAGKILKKIRLCDVEYFFSEDNVTFLKSGERSYPIGKSLEKLEDEYPSFFRISRKYLVNRDFIDKVIASQTMLKSGEKLTISRQRRKDFLAWFSQ